MNENPIGIFDSGVGGLTIYREIHHLLPHENIIYLADSKNAPYGEKTKEEIIELSIKNTEFLLKKNCKIIVVACNTASTNAVKTLRERYQNEFIRTQPGIKPAALNSKTKSVGILATQGTLKSDLLYETSQRFAKGVEVTHQIGEGLVKLIESDRMHSDEMTFLLNKYIRPMIKKNIDHLVLGCTHYPLLIPQLKKITGDRITIVDTGEAIARQTKNILTQNNLLNNSNSVPKRYFYTNKNKAVLQHILNQIDSDLTAEKIGF
jgi:glutamate racemase